MSHQKPISRNQHKLNIFLNGLLFVVGNYNISGSVTVGTKSVFKGKLPEAEFEQLATDSEHTPTATTKTTITFQLQKLKVKITN